MSLGTEVGLGPGDILSDEDPDPTERGKAPQFSAHVYCSQGAGWIKISLVREPGLGPDYIVLDLGPAPPEKKETGPQFSANVYCGQRSPISVTAELL